MLLGAFLPWVTVLVISVSGVDAQWGLLTLAAGVVVALAAYQIHAGGLVQNMAERTVITIAVVAALAGLFAPVYVAGEAKRSVAISTLQSANPFGSSSGGSLFGITPRTSTTSPSGSSRTPSLDGFGNLFTGLLGNALGPKLGFGIWLSILGALAALAGALDHSRSKESIAKRDDSAPWG
jgi:hypothetical protein